MQQPAQRDIAFIRSLNRHSADLDTITEDLFLAWQKALTAFAVFELTFEVHEIGVTMPRLDAQERCTALIRRPIAPEREVFGLDGQLLVTFRRADGYAVGLLLIIGQRIIPEHLIVQRQLPPIELIRAIAMLELPFGIELHIGSILVLVEFQVAVLELLSRHDWATECTM